MQRKGQNEPSITYDHGTERRHIKYWRGSRRRAVSGGVRFKKRTNKTSGNRCAEEGLVLKEGLKQY